MTKEYKYFVNMNDPSTYNTSKRITIKLNHPIDDPDIEAIEKQFTTPGLFGNTYTVANYKLIKVTGDFSYHVVFECNSSLSGLSRQFSWLCTVKHKVTLNTYATDIDSFITQLKNEFIVPKDSNILVKSFQEIPEE